MHQAERQNTNAPPGHQKQNSRSQGSQHGAQALGSQQQQQQQQQHASPQSPSRTYEHSAQTRSGRTVRIAHRRSPSELTPLVQERLALQQQIEMLQAQQHMLAQQQYNMNGMMPMYPSMPPPGMMPAYPYYAQPQMPATTQLSGSTHQRQRSGHMRRHSLHVSEARRAAQEEQQRRDPPVSSSAANTQQPQGSPTTNAVGSPGPIASNATVGSFKFPPSAGSTSPVRGGNQFTFPPAQQQKQQQGHARTNSQHRRSNSRNMDGNWRQQQQQQAQPPVQPDFLAPPQFVPGHRNRGSYSSISSISAFTDTNASMSGRKSLFVPYLSQSSIPQLLAEGLLVSGTLRVNRKNRSDAFVTTDVLDADVFICGSKDRNRALEGDLVAVELLDVNDVWDSKKEKEEKKRRRDANEDARLVETSNGELRRKGSLKQRPTHKRNDDVEVEGQTLLLKEEEQVNDETRPLYAGHVVAILERPTGQLFSGTLGLLRPSSQATKERQQQERAEKGEPPIQEPAKKERPKIVWFKPTDKCVPLMAIPTEQAPEDFVENHQKYADKIFVASIKRWPITSLHPFGTLVEQLGNDDEAVVTAVLRDNNFGSHKFTEAAVAGAQEAADEALQAASTSDAPKYTATAFEPVSGLAELSYTLAENSDSTVLSVHVIDLSPYIRDESPLDRELRHKCAGVYMRQLTSPLLPEESSRKLAFQKDKAVPALTVELTLAPKSFDIIDSKIFKSVVTPEKVVDYSSLQSVDEFGTLGNITNALRSKRKGYSLSLDSMLEIRIPCVASLFTDESPRVSSQIISELTYNVNAIVAQKLLSEYASQALLYRQPEPLLAKLETLATALASTDIKFDTTSAATLNESLAAVEDQDLRGAIEIALYKCLAPQRYAIAANCDPDSYGHYWLNMPAYTHFCGPLRRYADLVVQRQLHAVLANEKVSSEEDSHLNSLASELSFRLECAHNVQSQSIHLELSKRIEKEAAETGYILHTGIVVQVYESAFDVVIPELSLEKRVHGDQLPLVKAEFHKSTHMWELFWDPDQDAATFVPAQNSTTPPSAPTSEIAAKCGYDLDGALEKLTTRVSGSEHIQEIRMLQRVPVLLRADLGLHTLPSITVRIVNPFFKPKPKA